MISPLQTMRFMMFSLLVAVTFTGISRHSCAEDIPPVAATHNPSAAPTDDRRDALNQLMAADDEAFHAMLYWLPDTAVVFKRSIDTVTQPEWLGFEYDYFLKTPEEKKTDLLEAVLVESKSLADADWQARYHRMQLWMVLHKLQKRIIDTYGAEYYFMAARKIDLLEPAFAKFKQKENPTTKSGIDSHNYGLASAQMRWASGSVINRMMELDESQRIRILVQICLELADIKDHDSKGSTNAVENKLADHEPTAITSQPAATVDTTPDKPALTREDVIKKMAASDDGVFHYMLYNLPETKTIFSNVIDTQNPTWVGYEYRFFNEQSPEKKATLHKEIIAYCMALDDAQWGRLLYRMQLWITLSQQQSKLSSHYSTEPYFNAVYSVEKLRPVFKHSLESRKNSKIDPARIGESISSAEGNQIAGETITLMLMLSDIERLQSLVQICLYLAEHDVIHK